MTMSESNDTGLRCSRCAAPFQCGMDDAGGCWCALLPKLPAPVLDATQGCLCEACLRAELQRAGVQA
jgi:hypothetical protein